MKKLLFVLCFGLGTIVVANAQTTQANASSDNGSAQTVMASPAPAADVNVASVEDENQPGEMKPCHGMEAKSCCSSKKGKAMASKGSAGCCAKGKEASAEPAKD